MMTGVVHDIHPSVAVTCFAQVLDGLLAAGRVHPIVIAVYDSVSGSRA